jgi:formylglycine-generating enzyme required for sulfatase activity
MAVVSACQSSKEIAERQAAEYDKNCKSIGRSFGTLDYANCRLHLAQVCEAEAAARSGTLGQSARRYGMSARFARARREELRREKPNQQMQTAAVTPPKPVPAVFSEPVCEGLLVSVAQPDKKLCIKPGSGESFKDCQQCPEMVIVPSSSFMMGSPASEPERLSNEDPQHLVTIGKPFAVGKFTVTFAEWDACRADGGCVGYLPGDEGWGGSNRPVINVTWNDAKAYAGWLSKRTGRSYRLLSEAEREYVARAGTASPFWWGASISTDQANYDGNYTYGGGVTGEHRKETLPVASFESNPWGLYQVHGNVYDWVEDCFHDSYQGAPSDGTAWTTGECTYRVLRGGSGSSKPQYLRAAFRNGAYPDNRHYEIGFRVARTLN